MKVEDAPPAGWYPDPTGGARLWWWDGLDWTDHRSAPPNPGVALIQEADARAEAELMTNALPGPPMSQTARMSRADTQDLIAEVRQVARSEMDRASEMFTQRAQDATRQLQPLISQYSSDVFRWVRKAVIVALVLLIAWFLIQTLAQASLMDWLGERVDNVIRPE
ncbi:hypothetical protein BH24ACT15_BH24ACT15_27360 [soil metagenome]|jgi:hypothetical protein